MQEMYWVPLQARFAGTGARASASNPFPPTVSPLLAMSLLIACCPEEETDATARMETRDGTSILSVHVFMPPLLPSNCHGPTNKPTPAAKCPSFTPSQFSRECSCLRHYGLSLCLLLRRLVTQCSHKACIRRPTGLAVRRHLPLPPAAWRAAVASEHCNASIMPLPLLPPCALARAKCGHSHVRTARLQAGTAGTACTPADSCPALGHCQS